MEINKIESVAMSMNSIYRQGMESGKKDIKAMNLDGIISYLMATYGIDLVKSKMSDIIADNECFTA